MIYVRLVLKKMVNRIARLNCAERKRQLADVAVLNAALGRRSREDVVPEVHRRKRKVAVNNRVSYLRKP